MRFEWFLAFFRGAVNVWKIKWWAVFFVSSSLQGIILSWAHRHTRTHRHCEIGCGKKAWCAVDVGHGRKREQFGHIISHQTIFGEFNSCSEFSTISFFYRNVINMHFRVSMKKKMQIKILYKFERISTLPKNQQINVHSANSLSWKGRKKYVSDPGENKKVGTKLDESATSNRLNEPLKDIVIFSFAHFIFALFETTSEFGEWILPNELIKNVIFWMGLLLIKLVLRDVYLVLNSFFFRIRHKIIINSF